MSTGLTELEFDEIAAATKKEAAVAGTNWIQLAKEIAQMPNGIAVLRVLQAHGLTHVVTIGNDGIRQSNSIDGVIDYAHRER